MAKSFLETFKANLTGVEISFNYGAVEQAEGVIGRSVYNWGYNYKKGEVFFYLTVPTVKNAQVLLGQSVTVELWRNTKLLQTIKGRWVKPEKIIGKTLMLEFEVSQNYAGSWMSFTLGM